jgi:hypothetical protein
MLRHLFSVGMLNLEHVISFTFVTLKLFAGSVGPKLTDCEMQILLGECSLSDRKRNSILHK